MASGCLIFVSLEKNNNRYVIVAKIKRLMNNQSWWYVACEKCNRAAQPDGDKYKCSNPRCTSTSGAPRYRLPIIASDPEASPNQQNEPTIELVFFGTLAEEMIGVPADVLINSEGGVGAFLPTQITDLYGRKFELLVSVSRASLQRTDITYQVDSIIGTADAPLPLLAAQDTSLPAHGQEKTEQHTIAASSSSEPIPITVDKDGNPSAEQLPATNVSVSAISTATNAELSFQDASTDKPAIETTPQAQQTPAISKKKGLSENTVKLNKKRRSLI